MMPTNQKHRTAPRVACQRREPELGWPKVWNEIKVRKDALLRARHAFVSKLQDLQTFHIDYRDPEDLKTNIKHIGSLLTGYR